MLQIGVRLKKGWYGNPEGTELWDLDADTMAKLVDNGQAEYVQKEVSDVPAELSIGEQAEPESRLPADSRRKR